MNTMLVSPTTAQQNIAYDLVNSFLVEGFISEHDIFKKSDAQAYLHEMYNLPFDSVFNTYTDEDHFLVLLNSNASEFLLLPVQRAIRQAWVFQYDAPIYQVSLKADQGYKRHILNALEFFDALCRFNLLKDIQPEKITEFRNDLENSIAQSELLNDEYIDDRNWHDFSSSELFIELERLSAFRDRPFHPLAKLKDGFSDEEFKKNCPEFNQLIQLNWIAIRKDYLVVGQDVTDLRNHQPAKIFLDRAQYLELKKEITSKELDSEYLAIPIHEWQFKHILRHDFSEEIEQNIIVPLDFVSNDFYASSSLRSLLSKNQPQDSLKLPLAIKSLSSLRYLPIVKLINGQKNQKLLQLAKARDPILKNRLWLCDENQWWGYLPEQQDNLTPDNLSLFEKIPMLLSAQRRRIPLELLQKPYQIIPMASLGQLIHGKASVFDLILGLQKLETTHENVIQTFTNLCQDFFDVNLRLFRLGQMGEIHGQNICIVLKNGDFAGFMLRDHDSVRIHLDWMEKHEIEDPNYLSPHDFRITLYHDSVEDLVLYLQTLGIQVNLASILESISSYYQIEETVLWKVLSQQLKQTLESVPFTQDERTELHDILFVRNEWPFKQIIRPLLQQDNRVGSMPSSVGKIHNILKSVM